MQKYFKNSYFSKCNSGPLNESHVMDFWIETKVFSAQHHVDMNICLSFKSVVNGLDREVRVVVVDFMIL